MIVHVCTIFQHGNLLPMAVSQMLGQIIPFTFLLCFSEQITLSATVE